MTAVFLDAESLGTDIDFQPLETAHPDWLHFPHTAPGEAGERLRSARIAVTNKVPLKRATLESAPKLEFIAVAATGTNNVDLDAARTLGITVSNVRAYGTASVVQHVFALMLSLATNLRAYHDAALRGDWGRGRHFCLLDYPIIELHGKTLGIVGHGELGKGVAQAARAFGMNVLISARPGADDIPPGRLPLDQVLSQADVVSLHCPLTESTQNLFDGPRIARMKPGALLINAARGGIVNEQALADALRSGHLGGAGVDVLSTEPPREGNVLLDPSLPNLIVTPHTAWASRASRQRVIDQVGENIAAFLGGQPMRRVV
ncbi:MAG: 2-hydroxyacid dehydrogenase [Gammaproteobacteria bacterium]